MDGGGPPASIVVPHNTRSLLPVKVRDHEITAFSGRRFHSSHLCVYVPNWCRLVTKGRRERDRYRSVA